MYPTPVIDTPEEDLTRQQEALQSVTALRDELVESAPAKMMKGFFTIGVVLFVAYWLVGRR